jgi:hypothetical protein
MLSTERVIELARTVIADRASIAVDGNAAAIDSNLHDGIELARALTGGYVGQLTTAGERRLVATFNALIELRRDLANPMAYPWAEVTGTEEFGTECGMTVLTETAELIVHTGKSAPLVYAMSGQGSAYTAANNMLPDLGYEALAWHAGPPGTIRTGLRPL